MYGQTPSASESSAHEIDAVWHPRSGFCRIPRLASEIVEENLLYLILGTVVLGPLGEWLNRGGRRSRLRRLIQHELEIVAHLDSRPEVQARLNRRIDSLLDRYEPDVSSEHRRDLCAAIRATVIGAVLLVPAVLVLPDDPNFWGSTAAGGLVALLSIAIAEYWGWRESRRYR